MYQHAFSDASRPANKANPQGVSVNNKGDVVYAYRTSTNNTYTKPTGLIRYIMLNKCNLYYSVNSSSILLYSFIYIYIYNYENTIEELHCSFMSLLDLFSPILFSNFHFVLFKTAHFQISLLLTFVPISFFLLLLFCVLILFID